MTTDPDFRNIQKIYSECKANRERYTPLWKDIERYTGITVNPDYMWNNNPSKDAAQLDEFVDDPTSAISVNQYGDYLVGIIWGTGDRAFDIVPSRYVLELADAGMVSDWYKFATEQTLYHMNHSDAGFHTALRPYAYDQASFGTSGIGVFPNKGFENGIDDNALIFRNYGIDNTCIEEGKAGLVDIVFVVYHWRINQIVGEFCSKDGTIDDAMVSSLPKNLQDAYKTGDYNTEFDIVYGFFPRENYDPKLKGMRGTRYRGVWFMDQADGKIFKEESYAERPINICRQIKVRGQVYGRSSGTLLLSSIRMTNFIVGNTGEILEKMGSPPLGMFNNAVMGDGVLDTGPNGLVTFNQALMGSSGQPLFPIHDVGDPSGIIQFLLPWLNEKITTAFKVDALLDFNSAKDMTATESLQRYAIRGKSLSGMLQQQKIEQLEPTSKRSISLLLKAGELGVDPTKDDASAARAKALEGRGKNNRVIPETVLAVMAEGRPWYELKFNNELEKLSRTDAVQSLIQVLNAIQAIAGLYPLIIESVDWFKLLSDINNNLDYNNQILCTAEQFKAIVLKSAQQKEAAMALAAGQASAEIQKGTAQANKSNTEAQNARSQ